MLSELCYVLNIDEDIFYAGIFQSDPLKYLQSIINKKNFIDSERFLLLLDKISLTYNNYNKVTYLSSLLNNNYIEIKKNILNDNINTLLTQKKNIENELFSVLNNILPNNDNEAEYTDSSPMISTAVDFLEETLKNDILSIQNILVELIIVSLSSLSPYIYASKLQQFYNMLIGPNKKLKEKIRDLILYELIPTDELMATNLIQKIRYAIVLDLLSNEKFTTISKNFSFYCIQELINELTGSALIIVTANKSFARMLQINGLNNKIDDMKLEINYIPLDNLKYIMNSDFSNMYTNEIEKLYTHIISSYEMFKDILLENMYIFDYNNNKYVILYKNGKPYVACVDLKKKDCSVKFLDVSDNFKVFESQKNIKTEKDILLPTLTKNK